MHVDYLRYYKYLKRKRQQPNTIQEETSETPISVDDNQ